MARVVALVPAHNEGDRIGATVTAVRSLAVDEVVVVDDGSEDETASRALAAGATVLSIPRRAGKGRAMEGALRRLPAADVWLFADGDLGNSAAELAPVLAAVMNGEADLAIATFPPAEASGGGFGFVKRFAGRAIRSLTKFEAREPLSGQRAITATGLAACRPLAGGFGLETAMTIDAIRGGSRVIEIPAALSHRPTGRRVRGFAHRGRQGLDIARAVVLRALGMR